jgi:release factor glutamine methyltransferase
VIAARDAWVGGAERLAARGIESARLDARVLLAHVMDIGTDELLSARSPNAGQLARYEELLDRRAAHEPVAYITGEREFWSLSLGVGPGVLVPRPETETLIEAMLKHFPDRGSELDILDLGTGSGCLLISSLREFRKAKGTGVDRSERALRFAKANAEKLGVADRCTWFRSDWTAAGKTFDVILANPPYLAESEAAALPPDIAQYEPREALISGADGYEAYRAIAQVLLDGLKPKGRAFLEVGAGQSATAGYILSARGLEILGVTSDLLGIPRCMAVGLGFG